MTFYILNAYFEMEPFNGFMGAVLSDADKDDIKKAAETAAGEHDPEYCGEQFLNRTVELLKGKGFKTERPEYANIDVEY